MAAAATRRSLRRNPAVTAPRKRFGQHFLHDPGVIARIVQAIQPLPADALVEIGPGRGALTEPLLAAAGRLTAIELDRDLAQWLPQFLAGRGTLTLLQGDVLTCDFAALRGDGPRLRVVGNLPYNISTPLLFRLLGQRAHIADMHFMLQQEVAARLAAQPGGADYGRLSVMVQYDCNVELLLRVGAGAFNPPPQVESAFVRLTPHLKPPVAVADSQAFAALVAQAFSQRRKTVRNSLKAWLTVDAIMAAGVDPGARPEQLDLAAFAALSNALTRSREDEYGPQ